jgi:hypothetical protein
VSPRAPPVSKKSKKRKGKEKEKKRKRKGKEKEKLKKKFDNLKPRKPTPPQRESTLKTPSYNSRSLALFPLKQSPYYSLPQDLPLLQKKYQKWT